MKVTWAEGQEMDCELMCFVGEGFLVCLGGFGHVEGSGCMRTLGEGPGIWVGVSVG